MRPGRRTAWAVALVALLIASLGMAAPAAASGPHVKVKVIASGLDNPRGLTVDSHGRVLVALAGQGGPGGYGTSGKIIRISNGGVRDYRVGLPSVISPEGEVGGVHNVGVGRHGRVYGIIGGGPQNVDPRFSSLMRLSQGGEQIKTDFQVFRNAHPDLTDLDQPPNPFDTNVYGLASLKNGKHLVTDAGGNELLLV
ncbi:MAG: ScyD/ScyE family protein, partial [Chloroflexota bacterium]|nr:ScyD/ScyE family protein [Chloroflexota bacterium]